jgi:xanthine dehydrogenase small subunit
MVDHLLFYLNGERIQISGDAAFLALVDFLRAARGLVGTKVGCGEGDCGACTVLVGVPLGGTLRYGTVTSCIRSLYQLDGTHIVTIEGLAPRDELSPIQQAMIDHHGSQCGFCTPGIVVALAGLFESGARVDPAALRTGLGGNLCRCTGYVPILEAALSVDAAQVLPLSTLYPASVMAGELAARAGAAIRIESRGRIFFRPDRMEEALAFRARHPGAVIVSGGTELGVQRNKRGLEPAALLSLAALGELARIQLEDGVLSVGANVTWAELQAFSAGKLPEMHAISERFGSPQIRHVATLVGNIAHGSPVADSLCFLLIVGAELELASALGARRVGIEEFYHGPGRTAIAPDEIIAKVLISLPAPDELVRLYKISKRKDMDALTFRAGIRVAREGEFIGSAGIAFSGIGPVPCRLRETEAFLAGRPFSESTFREAGKRARAEIEPVSDVRGSRGFRLQLAENILVKYYFEAQSAWRREARVG